MQRAVYLHRGWSQRSRLLSQRLASSSAGAVCDVDFIKFQLFDVLKLEDNVLKTNKYSHISHDDIEASLLTSQNLASDYFLPHARASDAHEPTFTTDHGVTIIPEVAQALEVFKNAGFFSVGADLKNGGMQFPYTVVNALMLPFTTANVGTMSYPFLTIAAANMLCAVGSEAQLGRYLGPMLAGRFFGTMNLSETQAGSSLGDIATTATPIGDGKYSIRGSKMWISAGEHSMAENIVHMVLAKVRNDDGTNKPGVKGISLFIVPKYRVKEDGSLGGANDVTLIGLNHKMGYRGTTNCALSFGDSGQCEGELLGHEGRGLATMFLMMNEARIGVGLGAAALGYAGYAASLKYAQERRQGRPQASKDPSTPQVPIIQHPDVKRMLLTQKVNVEGGLALCFYGSHLVDLIKTGLAADGCTVEETSILLDTLTPIVKSWPSEWCLEANKWAIQIFGGYGYTRDHPVEQHYRDNRLNMIHEGTNGIQSLDLLARKMQLNNGIGLKVLVKAITHAIVDSKGIAEVDSELWQRAESLSAALATVCEVTLKLSEVGIKNPDLMISNSHEYLNMFGKVVIAWQWLRMETVAKKMTLTGSSSDFYRSKIFMSDYFFKHELPKIKSQSELLLSMDSLNVDCPVEYF